MHTLSFRKATSADIPFLAAAVKAAERVHTGEAVCTYEKLFSLSPAELDALLANVFSAEGSGHQLAVSSFHITAAGDAPVGCCAAWIEAAGGAASATRVATTLAKMLGVQKWNAGRAGIKAFSRCAPVRTPGALQLETFYVEPRARGRGVTGELIDAVLRSYADVTPAPDAAEIVLLADNAPALRAYEKAGFVRHVESTADDALFTQLTGSRGFIQLRKALGVGRER